MKPRRLIQRTRTTTKRIGVTLYRWPFVQVAPIYRQLLRTRFIGITGSAGKTTTKDLIFEILRSRFKAHKSHDTNNQLYTVARTICELRPGIEYCVQEVGVSGIGSMDRAAKLLAPSIAVVTNVRNDHWSGFPNDEAIAHEKAKLVRALLPGGIAVLNADDPQTLAMAEHAPGRVVTFGLQSGADLFATAVEPDWPHGIRFVLHHRGETYAASSGLHGTHLIHCVLAAVAAGVAAGMTVPECLGAVRDFRPRLGRMSIHTTRTGIVFVRDEWKAPFWSLPYPTQFMANVPGRRKFMVLGTISDYRGNSFSRYRDAVKHALEHVDEVVLVGANSSKAERIGRLVGSSAVHGFINVKSAGEYLRDVVQPGDAVLLKGSTRAEHLARLALMFDTDVRCWRERCAKEGFCDGCALLQVP